MFVINANRPETSDANDTIAYMRQVESRSGIKINALLNTTHMLKDTTKDDVLRGHELVSEVAEKLGLEFRYNVCKKDVAEELANDTTVSNDIKDKLFPIDLHFRDDWMS